MSDRQRRFGMRLSEEEFARVSSAADKTGLSMTDYLLQAALSAADRINLEMAVGKPPTVSAEVPKKRDSTVRYRKVIEEIAGLGHYWPVVKYVPDPELLPGMSYWTEGGAEYVWSGRMDEAEIENMAMCLQAPDSGLAFTIGPFNEPAARAIAERWAWCLTRIDDAEAQDAPLWLEDREDYTDNYFCAAWLHYVKRHPGLSSDAWESVCKAMGISADLHTRIRTLLTYCHTQRRGYLVAQYPWFGM